MDATLIISFNADGCCGMDLQENGVPKTLVLESLNNLSKFLATQIIEDAGFIPEGGKEACLNARINTDRDNLKKNV